MTLRTDHFWYNRQINIEKFSKLLWEEWHGKRHETEKFSPTEVMDLLVTSSFLENIE